MTAMVVPTVGVGDGPVPTWVPDAIRSARRRPAGAEDAWPAEVPSAVLALRLVRGGFSPVRRRLAETFAAVTVDDDEEHALGVVPMPAMRTAATGLTPGRHTLTVRVDVDDEDQTLQPVAVDVRPGTLVIVEVQPPPASRPDQPPAVSVRVMPTGSSQPVVQAALTERVSKGGPAERIVNAGLAKAVADPEDDDAGAEGPLAGTWTGGERYRLANWHARGYALMAVALGAFMAWTGRDDIGDLIIGGIVVAMGVVVLLFSLRKPTPVSLTVDGRGITLTRGREQTTAPLAEIAWATSDVGDFADTLTLTRRADPSRGPEPALMIALRGFDEAQRQEIRRVLGRHAAAAAEVPAASAWPSTDSVWSPILPAKSWASRPGRAPRVVFSVLVLVWAFFVFVMSYAPVWEGDGPPWFVAPILWVLTIPVLWWFVWAWRTYSPFTVTVDAVGVRIDRRHDPRAIAFRDVASVAREGIEQPKPGQQPAAPYLEIKPRRDYYARTGAKVPGRFARLWRIYRERFTQAQYDEMAAYLAQGVQAAGGDYLPEPQFS